ncbi:MAG: helix-turn-helix domain-containing protein [Desulfobacteraceae bacterium]|nr:helix-turn-helix domain-containing protein [Desulfobacteraceae bacterium]
MEKQELSPIFNKRYSTKEAASRLGLRPQTLANWRFQGRGPRYLKIGAKPIYREEDLEDYENAHLVDPEAVNASN